MKVIAEADDNNATLIAVLRLLAGHGIKPTRVASDRIAGTPWIAHRIDIAPPRNVEVEVEPIVSAIEALEGVTSAKIDHSA